jgi:hypothetical protein
MDRFLRQHEVVADGELDFSTWEQISATSSTATASSGLIKIVGSKEALTRNHPGHLHHR